MNRYLIVLILLLGYGLLLHGLNEYGLWVDEGWSVAATNGGNPLGVTEMVAEDVHPPLYFYGLHFWRGLTGDTVFAMRYFSVLVAVICAVVVFRLGKTLHSEFAGLLAAALYVLHDLVLVLGQEIRQYPQGQLFTVLLVWMYLRWWEKPTRPRMIALILAGVALLWTLYWGGFILLALGIHSLITRRNIIKPAIFIALGFMPWLPVLYIQITQQIGSEGLGHALPATWYGFQVLIYQLVGRPEWLWLGLAAIGILSFTHRQLDTRRLALGLVIIITAGLSILINRHFPILTFRMLSILIPLILILAAVAVAQLSHLLRMAAGTGVIMLSLWLPSAGHPVHLPWHDVAEFTAQHSAPDDVVLIDTWFDTYALVFYLDQHRMEHIPSELQWRDGQPVNTSGVDGLWLVRYSSDAPTQENLTDFIQTGTFDWQTDLSPITLIRYDRPPIEDDFVTIFGGEDAALRLVRAKTRQTASGVVVSLWWSPSVDLERNYSISTFLLDANGALVSQHDSYPLENYSPTASWQADSLYYDSHYLSTADLPNGRYQIGLSVYVFLDEAFTEIATLQPLTCAIACDFITLDRLEIR